MKLIYKFIILISLGGSLVAQTGIISGKVTNASTGLQLVGANVFINGTDRGAAADLEGRFKIIDIPEGKYDVTATMIGYAPMVQSVYVQSKLTTMVSVAMTPIVIESKQVVKVQGYRSTDRIFDQYHETNGSTTENLISMIEGVNLITRGSYAQEPIIRGMSGGQINITINGMKSFGACTDRMDPITSYMEADVLNSVEIGKGAISLLNGSTVGGSLNMTLIPPEYALTSQSNWQLKSGFNSASRERKVSMVWQKKSSGSGWILNSAYRKADDYSAANGKIVPFSQYEKMNLNIGYIRKINEKNQIHVELITDDAYDIGYASLPMDVGYARLRMLGTSLTTTGINPFIPKMEWKVYGNAIDHWMDDSKRDNLFMNMHMDMPGFTRTAGTYLDVIFKKESSSVLKSRSEFYWTSSYADMVMYPEESSRMKIVTWPDVKRLSAGQFVEYQSRFGSKISFNASMRYDHSQTVATDGIGINALQIYYPENDLNRSDNLVSGNVSFVYQINSAWQSIVTLAMGSRIPTVSEAFGYYLYNPVDGYLHLGNPDIPVEKSKQFEWRNRFESENLSMNLNIYQYDFDNYIFSKVMSDESLGYAYGWKQYTDGGHAGLTGIEFTGLFKWNSNLVFMGGINYEFGRLTDLDDHLPLIPPLEFHGSIKYGQGSYWIQFDIKGASEQNHYSILSGENATPSFLIFGMKSEYTYSNKLKISAGVDNLTNQLYYDHLDWGDIYRPGRSVFISLTIDQFFFQ